VDPAAYAVRRSASIGPASAAITLAKFGHAGVGPIGPRVVALPDVSGLLVAADDGVRVVNGKDLRAMWTVPTGAPVDAIGTTPDGSLAFALTRDGRIVAFDPRAKGRTYGEVSGGPFDGLVAVGPW